MIKNIWKKLYDRITADLEAFNMKYWMYNEDGGDYTLSEVQHKCGTTYCVLGHAILIAKEEGRKIPSSNYSEDYIVPLFGAKDEGEFKEIHDLFFFNEEDALDFIKRKAGID